ncbi:MAG: DUF1778 domain-containing protein [Microcoleaceae cyanobacterium]
MSETSLAKDSRIDLRVTKEQKALLEQAASIKGVSLSAYTLLHLLPLAQQEIENQEKLTLSNRDRDRFLAAIDNPPQLKGKLLSAIANYRNKYSK